MAVSIVLNLNKLDVFDHDSLLIKSSKLNLIHNESKILYNLQIYLPKFLTNHNYKIRCIDTLQSNYNDHRTTFLNLIFHYPVADELSDYEMYRLQPKDYVNNNNSFITIEWHDYVDVQLPEHFKTQFPNTFPQYYFTDMLFDYNCSPIYINYKTIQLLLVIDFNFSHHDYFYSLLASPNIKSNIDEHNSIVNELFHFLLSNHRIIPDTSCLMYNSQLYQLGIDINQRDYFPHVV